MCGIAGYFALDGLVEEQGRALLQRMGGALTHRGPDDRGAFVHPRCGLAVTRLAIIDPAGGHMPVQSESGDVVAVMNGEIYDHKVHREALAAGGHRFRSLADTETLPHLYEEHGPEIAQRLTGMFAFALFDVKKERLVLARDRFGIKPLFWAWAEDRRLLLFGSEVKAILASGRVGRRIDPRALLDVGSAGYPMPPRTMFAEVRALSPASSWELSRHGASEPHRYWRMPYPAESSRALATPEVEAQAVEALRECFDRVVQDHLLADVPVGSYLSGGVDSVSVAARARVLSGQALHTFSMGFGGDAGRFDESPHAQLAAEAMSSTHHPVLLAGIDEAVLRGTIRAMEAPQVHTVAFCLYQLSRAVREQGLKVVLSGEGADETFAGYGVFRLGRLRRSWLGRRLFFRRLATRVVLRRQRSLARALDRFWAAEQAVRARYGLVPPWVEQWWLLADAWAELLRPEHLQAMVHSELERLPDPPAGLAVPSDPLHHELCFEQATRLDGWVLPLGDRLGMAHGVEVRVPFLDHRLAELTARVPSDLLLKRFREKHLLRAAMAGRIPDALRLRRKRAFVAPISGWLFAAGAPGLVREVLSAPALERSGWLQPAKVQALLARVQRGGRDLESLQTSWALSLALSLQVFSEELGAAA